MLTVKVYRVKMLGKEESASRAKVSIEQPNEVSEKALKGQALTHSTG